MSPIKPKHQQIYDILAEELRSGVYPKGSKLPTTGELAKKLSVSVNIVTKAVELLKGDDLVTARAGSGIFSNSDTRKPSTFGFARLANASFPEMGRVKHLSIRVEDNEEWQLPFWTNFFRNFCADNHDVRIDARFGKPALTDGTRDDLIIGGPHFSNLLPCAGDSFHATDTLDFFHPDVYRDACVTPADTSWRDQCSSFPIGFVLPVLLRQRRAPALPTKGGIFDFIRSAHASAGKPYKYWSLSILLAYCGVSLFDVRTGSFGIDDAEGLLTALGTIQKLTREGRLAPGFDGAADREKLTAAIAKGTADLAEVPVNYLPCVKAGSFDVTHLPSCGPLPLLPVVCRVPRSCPFPEEALRITASLLEPGSQRAYFKAGLGFPVSKTALGQCALGDTAATIESASKLQLFPYDRTLEDAIESVVLWELRHHLAGTIPRDRLVERITRKVEYFLEAVSKS